MPEDVCDERAFLKRSSTTNGLRRLLFVRLGVAVMCLVAPHPAVSQADHKPRWKISLLPPTTGEPLTMKPLDMQDIDCVVAEWRPTTARPVLTLMCPPNNVFSPLRVLIKLSWMKPEDFPVDPEHILAPPGTPTKSPEQTRQPLRFGCR